MTLRPRRAARHPGYPPPAADRLAHEEPIAFRHEHGRLYDALETAAQLAELAGHDSMAASLRRHRRHVAGVLAYGDCGEPIDPADIEAVVSALAQVVRDGR